MLDFGRAGCCGHEQKIQYITLILIYSKIVYIENELLWFIIIGLKQY